MDQQNLSKLGRRELLKLLLDVTKENEELKVKVNSLQDQVDSREIKINNCGSIAEAALQLNEIFIHADEAAKDYLENVKKTQEDISVLKKHAEEEFTLSQQKCLELEENTRKKCALLEEETNQKCKDLLLKAKAEADQYNQTVVEKMNHLKAEYENMLNIFNNMVNIKPMVDEDE